MSYDTLDVGELSTTTLPAGIKLKVKTRVAKNFRKP
jgi:hypothetical protein